MVISTLSPLGMFVSIRLVSLLLYGAGAVALFGPVGQKERVAGRGYYVHTLRRTNLIAAIGKTGPRKKTLRRKTGQNWEGGHKGLN